MISLLLGMAFAADAPSCAAPTRAIDVRHQVDAAYASLEGLDIDAFKEATVALDAVVPCLSEALSPALVAEIHRTKGILAFGQRDTVASEQMFAAARAIEPGYRFPYNLIPDGNPIRDAYLSLDLATKTTERMPDPAKGDLRFDGYSSAQRPTSWPTLVQYLLADGSVSFSAYLGPPDPVPDYPVSVPPPEPQQFVVVPMPSPTDPPPAVVTPPKPHRARVPLLVAAGLTAVGSGVAYGLAGAGERRFNDPTTPDDELDGIRSRTNTMVVVSGFGGVAAAGLTIAGIATK